MVPFAPHCLQVTDFRQNRTESNHYLKTNDPLVNSTPSVYNSNYNPHFYSGNCSYSPDKYNDPCNPTMHPPLQYSPSYHYLSSIDSTEYNIQIPEFPLAPPREDYTPPQAGLGSSVPIPEEKYDHSGLHNYGCEYNSFYQMPSAPCNFTDMDASTEIPRITVSPNSTLSSSDVGSVGFNSDEQTHFQQVESNAIITESPSMTFYNGIVATTSDKEHTTPSATQMKSEKDLERRRKNNEASRKSRAQRRDRFIMEVKEVEFLKAENMRLRGLLKELELAIKEANDALISKFQFQTTSDQSMKI